MRFTVSGAERHTRLHRRDLLALLLAGAAAPGAYADDAAAWAALRGGAIVLLRHADAPGTFDPPGFRLDDCGTQRNLSDDGRAQASRIGARLRSEKVNVGEVWCSQWCRTRETARLLALGTPRDMPVFNSFGGNRGTEPAQTAAAREALRGWRGEGALVVVTHQFNISALTGLATASGEGIVLRRGALEPIGSILR